LDEEEIQEDARFNGRADIVLWWNSKRTPRAIVEVKHRVANFEKIRDDLKRIEALLGSKSDMQFGILAYYIDYNKKSNKLEEIVAKTIDQIGEKLNQKLLLKWKYEIIEIKDSSITDSRAFTVVKISRKKSSS
jgi:hypothetical protein